MEVTDLKVVGIDYTLKNNEGNVLDTSEGKQPLQYIHGSGAIIPGLEKAMVGKTLGDKFTVSIEPIEAYGEKRDDLTQKLEKSQFDIDPQVGMQFQADTPNGPTIITIVEVGADFVVVDANHPLAGVTLNFDIEVVELREATQEEIDHGHVHATAEDCCGDTSCGC